MTDFLVSIVMPSYNSGLYIKKAIDSVMEQTYSQWELIIIDNFSVDNTIEIATSYQCDKIKIFKTNNQGIIAKSRNLGIQKSSGSLIAFLDSDDWWIKTKLEKSVTAIYKGYDVVYHDMFFVKNTDDKKHKLLSFRKLKTSIFQDLLLEGNAIINSSVVIKKNIIEKVGLLDERIELVAIEDYDYWLRVSILTDKFFKLTEVLGFYWFGGENLSKTRNLNNSRFFILNKYISKIPNKLVVKASGYIDYVHGILLLHHKNKTEARKYFIKAIINGCLNIKFKSIFRYIFLYTIKN